MKRKILSIVCVLALVLSLLPTAAFATSDIDLRLDVSATVGADGTERNLNELRAGDIVTAKIILPANCTLSGIQATLNFDKDCFEVVTATESGVTFGKIYSGLPKVGTSSGWTKKITDYQSAQNTGKVSVAATGEKVITEDISVSGDVVNTEEIAILDVTFRVKSGATVGNRSFSVSEVVLSHLVNNRAVDYTVGLPAPVSATVVQELGNVTLSGSVTAPAKNVTDTSALTGEHVTANVSWSPALTDNKFAANTPYTATAEVLDVVNITKVYICTMLDYLNGTGEQA